MYKKHRSPSNLEARRLAKKNKRSLRTWYNKQVILQNDRCHYCKIQMTDAPKGGTHEPTTRTKDHVIPRIRGGPHDVSNMVLCCFKCNCRKGFKTPQEFQRRLDYTITRLE